MPVPFGYMFYDKTEIDSEACEVTVTNPLLSLGVAVASAVAL